MPMRPCRGTPDRKPVTIATSPGSSAVKSSARMAIFCERELVSASRLDAATTSASGVMTMSFQERAGLSGSPRRGGRRAEDHDVPDVRRPGRGGGRVLHLDLPELENRQHKRYGDAGPGPK